MDNTERKSLIRKRLKAAKFPRRASAVFDDANNHNPVVLQDCHACRGSGKRSEHRGEQTIAKVKCPECDGRGITGEIEPYFDRLPEPVQAKPNAHGWVKCPLCGISFHLSDRHVWTGRRHRACGQEIVLPQSTLSVDPTESS